MIIQICDVCGTQSSHFVQMLVPTGEGTVDVDLCSTQCVLDVLGDAFGEIEEPEETEEAPEVEEANKITLKPKSTGYADSHFEQEKKNKDEADRLTAKITGVSRRGLRG